LFGGHGKHGVLQEFISHASSKAGNAGLGTRDFGESRRFSALGGAGLQVVRAGR
jgi:hypothetical protein